MNGDRVRQRRLTENMVVRCPVAMRRAIDGLADRELISSSDYVRRAVLRQLHTDGIDIDALREAVA